MQLEWGIIRKWHQRLNQQCKTLQLLPNHAAAFFYLMPILPTRRTWNSQCRKMVWNSGYVPYSLVLTGMHSPAPEFRNKDSSLHAMNISTGGHERVMKPLHGGPLRWPTVEEVSPENYEVTQNWGRDSITHLKINIYITLYIHKLYIHKGNTHT